MNDSEKTTKNYSTNQFLRFLIPSLIGAAVFLLPIPKDGTFTIVIGILADALRAILKTWLPYIGVFLVCLSALLTVFAVAIKKVLGPEMKMFLDFYKIQIKIGGIEL